MTPWTSKRGLMKARLSVSKMEEGFGKVSSLFDTLRESDPNTTTDIVVQDGHFHRAFLCPGACSRAFGLSLHVIGVDGCHLKTKYGGVLLVATALDGNSNIFPICIGIAEGENSDSWTWFLRNARVALGIGEGTGVVVLSDMEKGLERALADVLPQAQHGLCLFHIEKNFVKKFKTNMNGVCGKPQSARRRPSFTSASTRSRSQTQLPQATSALSTQKSGHARTFWVDGSDTSLQTSRNHRIRGLKSRGGSTKPTSSPASFAK